MSEGNAPPGWLELLFGSASGVILWFLSWVRSAVKENRDAHEAIGKDIARIKGHLDVKDEDEES